MEKQEHVYAGQPDARQGAATVTRFRPRYRNLDVDEKCYTITLKQRLKNWKHCIIKYLLAATIPLPLRHWKNP